MDNDLWKFADKRREWIERDLGLHKMPTKNVQNPWGIDSYKTVEQLGQLGSMAWDTTTNTSSMYDTFKTKEIKINTKYYKEDYREFYDILKYREDELGNLFAKQWDREFYKIIHEEDESMNKERLVHFMGDVDIGDVVIYFNNGKPTFDRPQNKDMWYVQSISEGYNSDDAMVLLESVSRVGHKFETRIGNLLDVQALDDYNLINTDLFNQKAINVFNNSLGGRTDESIQPTEDRKMAYNPKSGNMVKRTTDSNVSAAKVAATITAGKTLNTLVASKVTPQLPLMVRGYADTAVGRVVIANIADFAVKQFMSGNPKANMATEAMMQAAMLELADSFDLEGIVTEIVDSVALDIPEAAGE